MGDLQVPWGMRGMHQASIEHVETPELEGEKRLAESDVCDAVSSANE